MNYTGHIYAMFIFQSQMNQVLQSKKFSNVTSVPHPDTHSLAEHLLPDNAS